MKNQAIWEFIFSSHFDELEIAAQLLRPRDLFYYLYPSLVFQNRSFPVPFSKVLGGVKVPFSKALDERFAQFDGFALTLFTNIFLVCASLVFYFRCFSLPQAK